MNKNLLKSSLLVALLATPLATIPTAVNAADQRPDKASAKPDAPNQLGAKAKPQKPGLLLPAVQAAPHAPEPGRPTGMRATTTQGNGPQQAADTTCQGVDACNDMIATCIALGGNVSQTEYEPGSGAPSGATCFSPSH